LLFVPPYVIILFASFIGTAVFAVLPIKPEKEVKT